MSPKTGRPKAENPKNINVKVRFDKVLYEKLDLYCQENKITKTEAIRKGIDLLLSNKNRNVPTDQS